MSPEIHSILTIVGVGFVSFLIGWLITSSRWKRKYQDTQLQSDQLVSQTTTLTADLNAKKKEIIELKKTNKNLEQTAEHHQSKVDALQSNLKQAQHNSKEKEWKSSQLQLEQEKSRSAQLASEIQKLKVTPPVAAATPLLDVRKKNKKKKKKKTGIEKSTPESTVAKVKKSKSGKKKKIHKILSRITTDGDTHTDDLTAITGIGPEISKRLNNLGIKNYKQLSRLTDDDLVVIDKSLEFFPGRAYRNNWIGQAKVLAEKGIV